MKRADPYYLSRSWRALRELVLRRDGGLCTVPGCAQRATHVDHIVARKDGGPDMPSNLRSLCQEHDNQAHREKGRGGGKRDARFVVRGCGPDGWPLARRGQ